MATTEHERHEGESESHRHGHHDRHAVSVTVNGQPVKLHVEKATGREIKTAAIEQGVNIHERFVLREELSDGENRAVGNEEEVHLREGLR